MDINVNRASCLVGGKEIILETGRIARQATAAVWASSAGTRILVTVVAEHNKDQSRDFLPLIVNYQERFYACGRVLGGFHKRENRPTERETLLSRLIDRSLRPLFPAGFCDDIQVIATVHSYDPEGLAPEILTTIAASAALKLSGLPFQATVSAAKVGHKDGAFCLLHKEADAESSALDMVVSFTKDATMMVESFAKELTEETMLDAIVYGRAQVDATFAMVDALCAAAPVTPWVWQPCAVLPAALETAVQAFVQAQVEAAYAQSDKVLRNAQLAEVKKQALAQFAKDEHAGLATGVLAVIDALAKSMVRTKILAGLPRIDKRDTKTVRALHMTVGDLPMAHGSAIFTRGETQALASVTLSGEDGAQLVDDMMSTHKERFMLHYNFPPFSVGEVRPMMAPKRREFGHGQLAKRALASVLPSEESFPYAIRVVSEITESNGSSSMASVCGATLALMDAGVPLATPIAGIAMGLIKEGSEFKVLTDILGDEDHLGDMDFKVAGSHKGITALQMDIKIQGITHEIMTQALAQAKDARQHILSHMNDVLAAPRGELSRHAPKMITFSIHPDKIREVIGRGGATIKEIIENFGVTIDISDGGLVKVQGPSSHHVDRARSHIVSMVAEVEVGQVYHGKIIKILDFGAFVSLLPGKDGFLHISQIAKERVEEIRDWVHEGQAVSVRVSEIDKQGRVRLALTELMERQS
jgi:polyribonucleotide nucleotidyltransferase